VENKDFKFYEGQKLAAIMIGEAWIRAATEGGWYSPETFMCKSITIVMESSQTGVVPWVIVEYGDGSIEKFNLAYITGVGLQKVEKDDDE